MIGASSARNWTKVLDQVSLTKSRFSLPDRGEIGSICSQIHYPSAIAGPDHRQAPSPSIEAKLGTSLDDC